MRRREYQEAIEELKRLHPWLAKQVFQPAPGHLAVVTELIDQCERLMHRSDYQRRPLFRVTATREKLTVRVEVSDASIQRERALLDVVEQARHAAQQCCPVCGAPVFGGDANAPKVLGALRTSKWSDCSQRTSSVSREPRRPWSWRMPSVRAALLIAMPPVAPKPPRRPARQPGPRTR